ncbi:unnamed protein product [Moneuplotes crassus]|uniref:FYVE-type domain-containing protein n=1 Tax=Euplotes crassus TaxID=5936 RepID=A0AAD1XTQ3_EUPCR|nr:unnamed protein product [Moneuplotes crassus]
MLTPSLAMSSLSLYKDPKLSTLSIIRKNNQLNGDEEAKFEEKDFCQLCGVEFKKIFKPRHHCRSCLRSVCSNCSKGSGKNRMCDMCITEEENQELKNTYEGVLDQKQAQLEALKHRIINLDSKTEAKKKQLEIEKQNLQKNLEEKLNEAQDQLKDEVKKSNHLKIELEYKREELLKSTEDKSEAESYLTHKRNDLKIIQQKLADKETELAKTHAKVMKYQLES